MMKVFFIRAKRSPRSEAQGHSKKRAKRTDESEVAGRSPGQADSEERRISACYLCFFPSEDLFLDYRNAEEMLEKC